MSVCARACVHQRGERVCKSVCARAWWARAGGGGRELLASSHSERSDGLRTVCVHGCVSYSPGYAPLIRVHTCRTDVRKQAFFRPDKSRSTLQLLGERLHECRAEASQPKSRHFQPSCASAPGAWTAQSMAHACAPDALGASTGHSRKGRLWLRLRMRMRKYKNELGTFTRRAQTGSGAAPAARLRPLLFALGRGATGGTCASCATGLQLPSQQCVVLCRLLRTPGP